MEPTPIYASYQVGEATYTLQPGTMNGRPIYKVEGGEPMLRSESANKLVKLVADEALRWKEVEESKENTKDNTVDLKTAKKGKQINQLTKLDLHPKGTSRSACGRCWKALSSGVKGILGIGFVGASWASTAAVCSMAYAKRTIVHFVPAVVNTMVNGTVTTVPNPFNATAFNATCVNDTAKNAADQYCVYEDRVGSLPHAIAAVIMLVFSIGLTKRAIAGIR